MPIAVQPSGTWSKVPTRAWSSPPVSTNCNGSPPVAAATACSGSAISNRVESNSIATWEALAMWDKSAINGTELRAFAGNFLYSTGANEVAGRFCRGHFDLPMRHCTVALDGDVIVDTGVLRSDLA